MAEKAPFKVVPYDMGAANVVDRASDEKIGYVLAAFNGWQAFLSVAPGVPLVADTVQWTDPRLIEVMGSETHEVKLFPYRADAAEKVYAAWQATSEDRGQPSERGRDE